MDVAVGHYPKQTNTEHHFGEGSTAHLLMWFYDYNIKFPLTEKKTEILHIHGYAQPKYLTIP